MLEKKTRLAAGCALLAFAASTAFAAADNQGVRRLKDEFPGTDVSVNAATETASFVRVRPGQAGKASGVSDQDMNNAAVSFVSRHSQAFGLRAGSRDLKYRFTRKDELGYTHVRYTQEYGDVPVFGASLSAHFDANSELVAVTGTLVPDINLSIAPSRSSVDASATALRLIEADTLRVGLSVRGSRLVVYREGLAKGIPGPNHLAWEVEVGNGRDVREFVFVDAHTGKFIERLAGITDGLYRRAFDGMNDPAGPPTYPDTPFWEEGDGLPTGNDEADNMLLASEDTYNLFFNAFGRDSFDGAGAVMDSIFDRGYGCPNASWNGVFISFCAGLTTDDVTGHEWAHAYTDYTDDLIYAWQPGALNESYSDVAGETVDQINGRDQFFGDKNNPRTPGSCSAIQGTQPPTLEISGGPAAGSYFVTASVNEPDAPFTRGPAPVSLTEPADACAAISNDVAGKIAIIDWEIGGAPSNCGSTTRAANLAAAGAEGIIFVAPSSGLLNLGSSTEIGSVQVNYADGEAIKAGLPSDATMTFELGSDDSVRWLLGEDSTADGSVGAIRDMYTPGCFGDPGKVTDQVYWCSADDNGGVHINSGIPNHAFSLMVDGGSFNGQTISGIGLTKANHIEFRAKTHYQGPATDFAGHADALEQACSDLTGVNLASLTDGSPSGEVISASDCEQVAKAIEAVELRTPPTQCAFEPLLAQNPPPYCDNPHRPWPKRTLFYDGFEVPRISWRSWRVSKGGITEDFTRRHWDLVKDLPDARNGRAFFGPDPTYGTCAPGGDETAVLHLDSPWIKIPRGTNSNKMRIAFDHWVATESGWDGANIKIKVNNGPWVVVDPADFVYNPYNIHSLTGWNYIVPAEYGNTNPLAGEYGWSGTDAGSVDGTWGRSIINLKPYAKQGDKVRLRFDIGNDGCGGAFGWYVDDVKVYECR